MTNTHGISTIDDGTRQVQRRIVVNVPADDVFAIVSDPRRHHELDGSGTVGPNITGPETLFLGAHFTTRMTWFGIRYRITSHVTAFQQNRLIEWRHPLGHRWRWQLQPLSSGATAVIETFDYRDTGRLKDATQYYRRLGLVRTNEIGIEATLTQLQARFTADNPQP